MENAELEAAKSAVAIRLNFIVRGNGNAKIEGSRDVLRVQWWQDLLK